MTKLLKVDSAILLAIITVFFYLVGTTGYHGYINSMGLESSLLEKSYREILYKGLLIFLDSYMDLNNYIYILTAVIISMLFIHGMALKYLSSLKLKYFNFSKEAGKNTIYEGGKNVLNTVFPILIVSLLVVLLFSYLVHVHKVNNFSAKSTISNHIDNSFEKPRQINIKLDGKKRKMTLLVCGSSNCAAIENDTNIIFYFPTSIEFNHIHGPEILSYKIAAVDKDVTE
ncbi:hypothetical protein CS022_03925 [Veronia nyctiphanis]|uniref:Uncharacterized protein n=1 Tax=Veronia nyctiphanis TaxID=1278244 RepID=A0A4Q0YTZ1_9GAMM|nr:hypothetical protein [Veronia nyctiphanis]RXJ74225.1 hypothetical protein CS022_03925 [Veronia nyctiphanis]